MRQQDSRQTPMQILQRLVSSYWPAISRADLAWIRGSRERLLHVVVRTYGLNRETAERQIRAFSDLIKLPASERQGQNSSSEQLQISTEPSMVLEQQQALPSSQSLRSDVAGVEPSVPETLQHLAEEEPRVLE